jgi:hypothetical protein
MRFKIFGKEPEPTMNIKPPEFEGAYFDGKGKQSVRLRLEESCLRVLDDAWLKDVTVQAIPYLQMHAIEQFPYSQLNTVFGMYGWIPFGFKWTKTDLFISIFFTGEDGLAQYAVFRAKEHAEAFQTICQTVDAYHRKKRPSAYRREPKTLRELNGLPPLDP